MNDLKSSAATRIFAVSLALVILATVGFAVAYPIQLKLVSNLPSFGTTTIHCTDISCSSFIDSTRQNINSGTNTNEYAITGSGNITYTELDYASCQLPHVYRFAVNPSTTNGPFTVARNFTQKSDCSSTINNIQLSNPTPSENSQLTITTSVHSAIEYPFESLSTITPPSDLSDYYDTQTQVVLKIKDSNNNVVYTQTKTAKPLMGKNDSVSFDYTVPANGQYTAEIETQVTDCACTSTTTKTSSIGLAVQDTAPIVEFTGTPLSGIEPLTVQFNDQTTSFDSLSSWLWDFGDGQTSTQQNPTHKYQNDGSYTVTLTVTDNDGSSANKQKTGYVNVGDKGIVVAQFTANIVSGTEPLTVIFDASLSNSNDGIQTYTWNFGDGGQSESTSQATIQHTYQQEGSYTVQLTARESDGNFDVETKSNFISVLDSDPVPDFTFSNAVEDQPVTFTSTSTSHDGITSLSWNFGDSGTATGSLVQHTYTISGSYQVVLTVTEADGDSISKTKTVDVSFVNDAPKIVINGGTGTVTLSEDFGISTEDLTQSESDEEDGPAADGNSLTWSASDVNTSLITVSVDPVTDVLTMNSVQNAFGSNSITLTLKDSGGLTATTTVLVTVDSVNDVPELIQPIEDINFDEDNSKTLDMSNYFKDNDTDQTNALTGYEFQTTDSNVIVTFTGSTANISSTQDWYGSSQVTLIAKDAFAQTQDTITVTVNPKADLINVIQNGNNVIDDYSVIIDSTLTDAVIANSTITRSTITNSTITNSNITDSTVIDSTIEDSEVENSFIDPTILRRTTVRNSNITDSTFEDSKIEGSDLNNAQSTGTEISNGNIDSGTVTINGENHGSGTPLDFAYDNAPKAQTINDVIWPEDTTNTSLNLNNVFSDVDGDNLTYLASTVDKINVSIGSNGVVTFTPELNFNGNKTVQFTATDPLGKSDTANATLIVTPVNDAPEITLLQPNGGQMYFGNITVTWTTSDIENDPLTINIDLLDGLTSVPISVGETDDGSFTFDSSAFTGSNFKIRLTASDGTNSTQDESDAVFSIDNSGPAVTNSNISAAIEFGEDIEIRVDVSDNLNVVGSVLVNVNGTLYTMIQESGSTYLFIINNPAVGSYNIQYFANDSLGNINNSVTDNFVVEDTTLPSVDAGQNQEVVEGDTVNFNGTANDLAGIASFAWDFDDSDGVDFANPDATGQNPTHVYLQNGTFIATLNITDNNGLSSIDTVMITVADTLPTAVIQSSETTAQETSVVLFNSSESTGYDQPLNFSWDFGDGQNDTGEFVSHRFAQNGTYTVVLTVTDSDGSTDTDNITITVTDSTPLSVPEANTTNIIEGEFVEFTDGSIESYDTPSTYFWNFGDGTNSTEQNATHQFVQNGTYIVKLTITDLDGSNDTSYLTITVNDTAPTAMAGSDQNIIEGDQLSFDGSGSSGYDQPLNFSWDFGDSSPTKSGVSVNHTYVQNGTFVVTLTVTDNDSTQNQDTLTVTVNDTVPIAGFTQDSVNIIEGNSIQFNDTSTPVNDGISSYFWDFGDGNNSILQNPSHLFIQNGSFNVALTITDGDGSANSASVLVTVNDTSPTANASLSETSGIEGQPVIFNASLSSGYDQPLSYFWDFGDGQNDTEETTTHTFNQNDTYTITLTVTDSDGSQNQDIFTVTISDTSPTANFSVSENPTEDQIVTINSTTISGHDSIINHTWNFGDESAEESGTGLTEVTHTYTLNGTYNVSLIVEDSDGSTNTYSEIVNVVFVNDIPQINGTIENITINEEGTNLTVLKPFESDEEDSDLSLTWSASDYNTSLLLVNIDPVTDELNVTGVLNQFGSTSLTLVLTDSGGLNATQQILITVNPINDAPVVSGFTNLNFPEDQNSTTLDLNLFVSDVDNLVSEITWSALGQSNISANIDNVAKTLNFTAAQDFFGSENITLTGIDPSGLNSSQTILVTVTPINDAPTADSLSVTDPTAFGQWLSGNDVNITAVVSDIDSSLASLNGVTLEYSLDSTNGTDGTWSNISSSAFSPFTHLWTSQPAGLTDNQVWIRVRARDAEGLYSNYLFKNISIDNQVPNTTHDYDGGWKTSDITVTLTADDFNGSGVNSVQYEINSDGLTRTVFVDGHPVITTEGINNITFFSTDNLGHIESSKLLSGIKLDKSNPIIENLVASISDITEDSTGNYVINVTVSDAISGLASTPTITYRIGNQSEVTNNLTLVSGDDYNFTIPEPAETWDFFRGENLTFTINTVDNSGRTNSTSLTDLIDDINDVPSISLDTINGQVPEYGFFSNSLELVTTATDTNDSIGNSAAAGTIFNVTFEYSLDSTNGTDGSWNFCLGSQIFTSPTFVHQCNSIIGSGEEDNSIWLRVQSIDDDSGLSGYVIQEIAVDNKAPVTTDNVTQEWHNATVNIFLNATDSGSGVNQTRWCRDTSNSCTPNKDFATNPISVSSEGISYLRYKSIDNVSNTESVKNKIIRIDLTQPQILTAVLNDNYVQNGTVVAITVNTTDALSGVSNVTADGVFLDSQGNDIWTGNVTLTDANAFVTVVSTDLAGNSQTDNSATYTIDNTPPDVNVTLTGHNNFVIAPQSYGPYDELTLVFTGSEIIEWGISGTNRIKIYHSSDPDAVKHFHGSGLINESITKVWTDAFGPLFVDGLYYINVTAVDRAGNTKIQTVGNITIDNTAPTIDLANSPTDGTISSSTLTINATATDPHSQNISIVVNNSVVKTCSFVEECLYNLTDGNYTFYVTANDIVGNNATSETRSVLIDTIAPQVSFGTAAPNNGSIVKGSIPSSPDTNFVIGSDSNFVNMTLYVDGVAKKTVISSPLTYSLDTQLLVDGLHYLNASAIDIAGNVNWTETREIIVDNTAPEISFNSPASGVYNSTQTVNITASDPHFDTLKLVNASDGSVLNSTSLTELSFTLTDGNWSVKGVANDTLGQSNETSIRNVLVDTITPIVSIDSLTNVTEFGVGNASINWSSSDTNLIVSFMNVTDPNGNEVGQYFSNTILTPGDLSLVGTYIVTVFAEDIAENNNQTSSTFLVNDTTGPDILSIFTDKFNNEAIESDNILISANVLDWSNIDSVNATVNGTEIALAFNSTSNLYEGSLTGPAFPGTYTINVTAIDQYGNLNYNLTELTVLDTTPPAVFNEQGATIEFMTEDATLSLNATDFSGIDTAKVFVNDKTYIMVSSGDQYTITIGTGNFTAPGNYTALFSVNDTIGNINSSVSTIVEVIDTTIPLISFLSPTPSNASTVSGTQYINVTASDFDLFDITIIVGGVSQFSCTTSPCLFEWNTTPDGSTEISALVTDASGNTNTTENRTVVIDNTNPSISFNSPESGQYNSTQTINITASDNHLDTIELYIDGSIVNSTTGTELIFVLEEGNWTVQAFANDTLGHINQTENRTILVDLTPPQVDLGSDRTVNEGDLVEFDVSNTSDALSGVNSSTFVWDFGDTNTATGQLANNTYSQNGTYTVTLNATDNVGNVGTTNITVTVNDLVPTANFTFNPSSNISENVTSVNFTDTSTYVLDSIVNWSWDFGDGENATTQNTSHTFAVNGTYNVTLTITDSDGSVNSYSQDVVVNDNSPTLTVTADPNLLVEGQETNLTVTAFSNPDAITGYEWDFSFDGNFITDFNSGLNTTVNRTFSQNGTQRVAVRVTDLDGSKTINTTVFEVNDLVPVLSMDTGVSTSTTFVNDTASYRVTQTDSNPDNITEYQWDFSYDGSNFNIENTTTANNIDHVFTSTGTFVIASRAVDSDGSLSNIVNISTLVKPQETHDMTLNSLSYNKNGSTVYLNDNVIVTANITNNGNFDENVTVKLRANNGGTLLTDTQIIPITKGENKLVTLNWLANQTGLHNLEVELVAVPFETAMGDNMQTIQSVRTVSVADNLNLSFVSSTSFPIPSSQGNEGDDPFFVWVQIDNMNGYNLNDLNISLDTDGLAITQNNQDGNTDFFKFLNLSAGQSTSFYWRVDSSSGTYDINVSSGNVGDIVSTTREVTIA